MSLRDNQKRARQVVAVAQKLCVLCFVGLVLVNVPAVAVNELRTPLTVLCFVAMMGFVIVGVETAERAGIEDEALRYVKPRPPSPDEMYYEVIEEWGVRRVRRNFADAADYAE